MTKEILLCGIIGYFVGCLNPAWLLSKLKNKDLRRGGTNNLGATNTFMILGKRRGIFVLLFDIGKSCAVIKIVGFLFPQFAFAGAIAGTFAIIGHIFPFYLRFCGGKGLACLGGVILGLDWKFFIPLLLFGLLLAVIINYACTIAFSSAFLFPVIYGLHIHSNLSFLILAISCMCIIIKHFENIRRIQSGKEITFRTFWGRLRRNEYRG
jgi:Predicted membrane protein